MVSHVRPHLPHEPRTGTWQTPGSGAARRADRQGLRGRWRHGMALTISDLSMARANAGQLRSHAIVFCGGRSPGWSLDTGVANAGMALTHLPESLWDGSMAQQTVLFGTFLPSVHTGRVPTQSLACIFHIPTPTCRSRERYAMKPRNAGELKRCRPETSPRYNDQMR